MPSHRKENIMSELTDVALQKPATQSSVSQWSHHSTVEEDALGANSGVIPPDYGFCTGKELNPWWQVDLEDEFDVEKVVIINRLNCASRLRNFSILKSLDGDIWQVIYQKSDELVVGGPDNLPMEVNFQADKHVARFIRVQLDGEDFLHLRTCSVIGRKHSSTDHQVSSALDPVMRQGGGRRCRNKKKRFGPFWGGEPGSVAKFVMVSGVGMIGL